MAAMDQAAEREHDYGFDTKTVQKARRGSSWIDRSYMTSSGRRHAWACDLQRRYFATTRDGVQFLQYLDPSTDDGRGREVTRIADSRFPGPLRSGRKASLRLPPGRAKACSGARHGATARNTVFREPARPVRAHSYSRPCNVR